MADHSYKSHIVLFCVFLNALFLTSGAVSVPTTTLYDGKKIPMFALGTWLGNDTKGHIEPSENEVSDAVTWALDAGYRHIDTAYAYKTEPQVGRAVKARMALGLHRNDLFITTKLWNDAHALAAVIPALRRSLQALGLDYVDLYLMHWPLGQFANKTYDHTDYLETWHGMIDAKTLGLTRSIGVSNFNQDMIDRIIDSGLQKPAVLQIEVNLNLQQSDLLAYCKEKNIVVMAYTPFGSMFYHKAKPDAPPPRIDEPTMTQIAHKYNKTVPQIALRYLVELGVIPTPKSLTKSRIEQNVNIFDFKLTQSEKYQLRNYDVNYRTVPQTKWKDHPYYPFEKD